MPRTIITATGCYIPTEIVPNSAFLSKAFYDEKRVRLDRSNAQIVQKLFEITGIKERRYVSHDLTTSDIAYFAARDALESTDPETLDYIIVGQNFGDVRAGETRADMVPTIASRVKHRLGIRNPYTVAFDVPFGCPGWLHGVILADYYIRSGDAKKVLVIGAEVLSRVSDPHDVDSMIFADGAGATLLEESPDERGGILSHVTRTDTFKEAYLLRLGASYNPDWLENDLFVKMDGHDIYRYALKIVPLVVKQSLEKAGCGIEDVAKIFVHQANEKMDDAILKRLFAIYGKERIPEDIMPMIISWTGNSSVATLPTMLDLALKERLPPHRLRSGDVVVFASVGAGMNVNAMVYRMP